MILGEALDLRDFAPICAYRFYGLYAVLEQHEDANWHHRRADRFLELILVVAVEFVGVDPVSLGHLPFRRRSLI